MKNVIIALNRSVFLFSFFTFFYLFITLLCSPVVIIFAQNPEWVIYNTSNGLPNNYITAIAVDKNGDKWIGTYSGGLAKFDGLSWTIYNTNNSSIPDNTVTTISIDSRGNKWIGTRGGLAKFDGVNWIVYNTANSGLPENLITSLAIDKSGNKWIGAGSGTVNSGLAKFDGVNWINYNFNNSGLPSPYVSAVAADSNGNIWIGDQVGNLAKFDGVNWVVYNKSNSSLPGNYVSAIAIDGQGNKWIGTDNGLAKFNGVNWTVYNKNNSGLPETEVHAISVDSYNNKWIGTVWGLGVYHEGGVIFKNSLSLYFDQINANSFPKIDCYVTVTDNNGNPITGLSNSNFGVYEDNHQESPIQVQSLGTQYVPVSVALVIDRSGSMDGQPISDAKSAASNFVNNMRSGDRGAVISFNETATIDQGFTSTKTLLTNAINGLYADGYTAIYDAANLSLSLISSETNPRKAILLLTDGEDNSSHVTIDSVISHANFLGIPIYCIGLGLMPGSSAEQALINLSNSTGGRYYYSPSSSDLLSLYNLISLQMQSQYLISYTTHNPAYDGSLRTVKIVVNYQTSSDTKEKKYIAPGSNGWMIKISAKVDEVSDIENYAGVNSNASDSYDLYDVPEPTAPPNNYIQVYFPHNDWGGTLGPYYSRDIRSLRNLTTQKIEWNFETKTDRINRTVSVIVKPNSLFPNNYNIVLVDLDANIDKVIVGSDSIYTYNSGSGGIRRFKLVVSGIITIEQTLSSGWKLFGVPMYVDSSKVINSGVYYYMYDYKYDSGYYLRDKSMPGKGFWFGLTGMSDVNFYGSVLKDSISIGLSKYWNIISCPYFNSMSKRALFIRRNGLTVTFDNAVNLGWISSALYAFSNLSYLLSDSLKPWQGYWLAALVDNVNLVYFLQSSSQSQKVNFVNNINNEKNWLVYLSVEGEGGISDKLAGFGIKENATKGFDTKYDYPKPPDPPFIGSYYKIYFFHPEWNVSLGPYFGYDVREPENLTWEFNIVNSSGSESNLKLSWDLSEAPVTINLVLVDLDNNINIDMRNISSYTFKAGSGEIRKFRVGIATGIESDMTVPNSYALFQNYPNPFNPTTKIKYAVPKTSLVIIKVYDILGREITTIVNEEKYPGTYEVEFNATNLPSGIYFYKMQAGSYSETKKMMLVK